MRKLLGVLIFLMVLGSASFVSAAPIIFDWLPSSSLPIPPLTSGTLTIAESESGPGAHQPEAVLDYRFQIGSVVQNVLQTRQVYNSDPDAYYLSADGLVLTLSPAFSFPSQYDAWELVGPGENLFLSSTTQTLVFGQWHRRSAEEPPASGVPDRGSSAAFLLLAAVPLVLFRKRFA